MKCFSFIYHALLEESDDKIISLLRRMLNLNKLTLYLRIKSQNQFLNPTSIITKYSMHMKQLHSFDYYISTENNRNDYIHTQEKLLNTNANVLNIVCFAPMKVTYHLFTVPFQFERLKFIGNIFPNVIFSNVVELWVHDIISFEHEFFLRIARFFPLLKSLVLTDFTLPSHVLKQSPEEIHPNAIARFPYLSSLYITTIGTRCIEQFLNENKTNLARLTTLRVLYEDLRTVTEDFTREATRNNCANIKILKIFSDVVGSKDFHMYFPLLNS